jgi:hypothetical protein
MSNAQHAAFYGFCLGVNGLGALNAFIEGAIWRLLFLGALAAFCAFAVLVFTLGKEEENEATQQ